MKRVSKYLMVLLLSMVLLTGCNDTKKENKDTNNNNEVKEEQKQMVCTRKATVTEGVTLDVKYTVDYTGEYINKVYSNEKVTSSNAQYLEAYKEQVDKIYAPYKNIEHYNTNVRIEGNTLISEATIDYDKIDTNKMLEVDSSLGQIIKDGKIKLADMKAMYTSIGAICE